MSERRLPVFTCKLTQTGATFNGRNANLSGYSVNLSRIIPIIGYRLDNYAD
jgi:hypothetical protein